MCTHDDTTAYYPRVEVLSPFRSLIPTMLALALGLIATDARAKLELDPPACPEGSLWKASGPFEWCEPSVCLHDANCTPGEVCRTVPLCVEVGTLADAGKVGEARLVATQRCTAGACPSSQVCSVKDRCLSKAAAQKLGVLEAPKPPPAPSAEADEPPVKKSACGCEVVGRTTGDSPLDGLVVVLGGVVLAARARRREGTSKD